MQQVQEMSIMIDVCKPFWSSNDADPNSFLPLTKKNGKEKKSVNKVEVQAVPTSSAKKLSKSEKTKNSRKFVYILAKDCKRSFNLTTFLNKNSNCEFDIFFKKTCLDTL